MNALIIIALCLSTGACIMTTVATNRLSASVAALTVSVSSAIATITTAPANDDVAINAAADQLDSLRDQIDRALNTTSAPTESNVVS